MADDQQAPQGGEAASDIGKVQPKKETVRINLPPKPTAAPTVKIPAPSAVAGAKPAGAAAPAAAGGVAGSTQKLPSAAPKSAPAKASPRPAPAMAPRVAASRPAAVSGADKALAGIAIIVTIGVAARLFFL
ncbi:MAG: hypothetical protein P8L18_06215 [Verrucomicrobiota bacterium]|nr:hypothetical protein [Verrucomicrobiota bacterium]